MMTDAEILQNAPHEVLVAHDPAYRTGVHPTVPYVAKTLDDRFERLDAVGLTYRYPDSQRRVEDIHLHLTQGSFTVITGGMGAGKTTLLRVLLGLLPREQGTLHWNHQRSKTTVCWVYRTRKWICQRPAMPRCSNKMCKR